MSWLSKNTNKVKGAIKGAVVGGLAGGPSGAIGGAAAGWEASRNNKKSSSGGGGGGEGGGGGYASILKQQIAAANAYAKKGAEVAPQLDAYANKVTGIGDSLAGYTTKFNQQAEALDPYIADFNRYAQTLWDQGSGLADIGTGLLRQGTGLMAMDGSNDPNSLAGRYEAWLRLIDPDKYVAMAAEDVQKSYDNTLAQQMRAMGRSGYDASSTRTAEFQQRFNQSLAAALAGAKTRARLLGVSEQGTALQQALDQAKGLVGSGADILGAGAQIEQAGAGLRGDAAKLETTKAQIYGMAADNEKSRASVYNAASNITAQKAQIYNNAAAAVMGGAQAAVGAMNVDLGYYKANLDYQLSQQQIKAQKDAANSSMLGQIIGAGVGVGALALLA